MARMLEALRQIEARCPRPAPVESLPAVEPPGVAESLGVPTLPPPVELPNHEGPSQPPQSEPTGEARSGTCTPTESTDSSSPFHTPDVADAPDDQRAPQAEESNAGAEFPLAAPSEPGRPRDSREQAFGDLAEAILAQTPADAPRVLLLTAPDDGNGTTATLLSLSGALARRAAGPILLVDADWRKADLTGRLGISSDAGLAQVLSGAAPWRAAVRETDVPHVLVLPGGRDHRSRLSDGEVPLPVSSNFRPLLKELRGHYRLILVDAPSLAHEGTVVLARHCDGTYLVVRLRHTSRRAVAESVGVLRHHGAGLLGCVVIDPTAPAAPWGWR